MIVVNRFRVPEDDAESFRADLERAHATLAAQTGYVAGHVGRNVDDPDLWLLTTEWEGAGRLPPRALVVRREDGCGADAQPGDRRAQRLRAGRAGGGPQYPADPVVRLIVPHSHTARSDRQPAGQTSRSPSVAKPPPSKLDTVVSLCKRRGFVFPSR